MNASDFTAEQLAFLSQFFGPGNALRWEAFRDGTMSEQARQRLSPLLDDLRQSRASLLLPHVTDTESASTTWYGLATDARHARALKEQLTAFVGPTYTNFTGQQAALNEQDPVEAALTQYFSPHVFRLRVLNSDDRQEVHRQIERLRNLRELHPDRAVQLVRPIGRILRDLEMAILVRNETSARQCLDGLKTRGRLSALNLAFLNVRILAAFERWSELRTLTTFRPLLDNRRPARVTEALIRCIYDEHFATFEAEGNLADCIATFREKESTFGTLFRSRGPISDPEILKAWLLRAVARGDREQIQTLLNEIPADSRDRRWAELLASYVATVPAIQHSADSSAIGQARRALDADNFDAAFAFFLQSEPTVDVIRQIIVCAEEIATLEATRQAIAFIEEAPAGLRDEALLRRSVARAWKELTSIAGNNGDQSESIAIPDDWNSWLHRLNTAGPWPDAVQVATLGSQEWSATQLRSNPTHVAQTADQLTAGRSAEATSTVRTILPQMVAFFLPKSGPVREFKPVYISLIYVLSLDDAIGADDLTALERLAEAVLDSAPSVNSPNDYVDLLESLETAWQQVRAFRHVDWALSVLDLLVAFNVCQHAPVIRFLHTVIDGFRDWSRRITHEQWDLIDLLASDLGQTESLYGLRPKKTLSDEADKAKTAALKGKTVAVYTLTERIGHRATELIERTFDGVTVLLLHDKAASDRLKQLATSADIFIINTWDATHAATDAIKNTRLVSSVTLRPYAKSATALFKCLAECLNNSSTQ